MKARTFELIVFSLILSGCFSSCVNENMMEGEEMNVTRAADFATTDYYWYKGEKIPLQRMEEKSYVMFYSTDGERFKSELAQAGITLNREEEWKEFYSYSCELTGSGVKKFTDYRVAIIEDHYEKATETLSSALYWAPYYRTEDGGEMGITNLFLVLLKPDTSLSQLEKLAYENSVEMLGADRDIPGWYYLACTNRSKGNSLEMANLFYETGLFKESNADFITNVEPDCINEPWFSNDYLWHLNNLSYPGIDINYCTARMIVPEVSHNFKVAIIDNGVANHPDLYVYPGWDAHTGNSPNYVDGDHGTQVAGFIGAKSNNGIGVAGIAHGAIIIPISVRFSETKGIPSSGIRFREAFNYAVNNTAKVINCSWGDTGYDANRDAGIINALDKECVVVFSSGNEGTPYLNFPKALDPRLLVVGGIYQSGYRKSNSNYGDGLDVIAPGHNLVLTTSNRGYTINSGTSFACPQVSGIAALILSINPVLTGAEVGDIIESTCRKINPSTYNYGNTSAHQNGTWHEQMGYGLVDAGAAVAKAQGLKPRLVADGPLVQFSPVTMTWENLAAGNDYMFLLAVPYFSDYLVVGKGQSGNSFTFVPPVSGRYNIHVALFANNSTYFEEQEICVAPGEPAWIEGPATLAPGEIGTYRLRTASQTSLDPIEGGENGHTTHFWSGEGYGYYFLEVIDSTPTSITLKHNLLPDSCPLPSQVTVGLTPKSYPSLEPPLYMDEPFEYTFDITITN